MDLLAPSAEAASLVIQAAGMARGGEVFVEEAVAQFFDKGYEATSLESIAESLGVTKQFIYSRFRSKAELLVSICHAGAAAGNS